MLQHGMQTTWWIWLLGALLSVALEAAFGGSFVFVFFGLAAGITALLVGLGQVTALWQASCAFAALSILSLAVLRRPLMRLGRPVRPLADERDLIGHTATVIVAPMPGFEGQVQLRGVPWRARLQGDQPLGVGATCRIIAVDNLTLTVQPER
jgi:membrane protein implicated in regulation of membrane protease activity